MADALDFYYGILPINTSYLNDYELKYLKNNKVLLLPKSIYSHIDNSNYKKSENVLNEISRNNKLLENLNISMSADLNEIISTGKYKDIVMLSEQAINNRVFEISSKIEKDRNIKVILITGPVAAGKSTIAKKLALVLKGKGYNPIELLVDDFNRENEEIDVVDDLNNIDIIDTNLFNNKVDELLDGKEVLLPRFDFKSGKRKYDGEKVRMQENSILIVEGIYSFNDKLTEIIPDKNKFKIFVSPLTPLNIDNHNLFSSSDNRLLRKIVMNSVNNIGTPASTISDWRYLRNIEEEIIMPYINDADEVINTSLVYELGVLKTYAEPLLFSILDDDPNYDEVLRLINMFRVLLAMPSECVLKDSVLREFIGNSCFDEL